VFALGATGRVFNSHHPEVVVLKFNNNNNMEYTLFLLFSSLLVISSISVIFVQDSVKAVFFLIFAFCNGVGLLFLVEAEFLGLLFLVVYLGAIAVLFLFVIIILNLKNETSFKFKAGVSFVNYYPLFGFIIFICYIYFSYLRQNLVPLKFEIFLEAPIYCEWVKMLDSTQSLFLFSQTLYTFYFYYFLIAGFVLLVAILGAISLTSQKNHQINLYKKQHVHSQLTRDLYAAVFLIKKESR